MRKTNMSDLRRLAGVMKDLQAEKRILQDMGSSTTKVNAEIAATRLRINGVRKVLGMEPMK